MARHSLGCIQLPFVRSLPDLSFTPVAYACTGATGAASASTPTLVAPARGGGNLIVYDGKSGLGSRIWQPFSSGMSGLKHLA